MLKLKLGFINCMWLFEYVENSEAKNKYIKQLEALYAELAAKAAQEKPKSKL